MSVGVAVLKAHLTSNGWPPSCIEASPLFDISAAVCRVCSAFLGNVCECVCVYVCVRSIAHFLVSARPAAAPVC